MKINDRKNVCNHFTMNKLLFIDQNIKDLLNTVTLIALSNADIGVIGHPLNFQPMRSGKVKCLKIVSLRSPLRKIGLQLC